LLFNLLNKKTKKILNVKKFIKGKLNGGRLNEVKPPAINNNKVSNKNFFFNLIK
tara:strand:- start:211 stop:372 length:162 start_codon:yes stop_codon:yes gene_type:complete